MSMGALGDKLKGKVQDTVSSAKESAGGVGAASMEKLYEWLDEFNHAMEILDDFGFKVDKLNVGSGLIPNIQTSIVGSLEAVDLDIVEKAITEFEGKKIIVTLMKSIRTAKTIRDHVSMLPFSDVRIDVTLGWPPDISLDFI